MKMLKCGCFQVIVRNILSFQKPTELEIALGKILNKTYEEPQVNSYLSSIIYGFVCAKLEKIYTNHLIVTGNTIKPDSDHLLTHWVRGQHSWNLPQKLNWNG